MTMPSNALDDLLAADSHRWLVTGVAGFIGSHLLETLLRAGQEVVGLDNFATGHRRNLEDVRLAVGEMAWARFRFIEGDIRDVQTCREAVDGVELVLHQAALGSVPRSIQDPLASHRANVDGFLNVLDAARVSGVRRLVYASSSSVYGDHPGLPKREELVGNVLSPYALTKRINEEYADVYGRTYGFEAVGLRYFNVFGSRQDPDGPYAAVIPRWVAVMLAGKSCVINGDGETSRDFCYVANAVQANLRAALTTTPGLAGRVFNVAVSERTNLSTLHTLLQRNLAASGAIGDMRPAEHAPFRPGDVRHSLADISLAAEIFGYRPTHTLEQGLVEALPWYVRELRPVT
jgi:UDP-N-acetylglucosamine 4-epimerase